MIPAMMGSFLPLSPPPQAYQRCPRPTLIRTPLRCVCVWVGVGVGVCIVYILYNYNSFRSYRHLVMDHMWRCMTVSVGSEV